MSEWTSEKPTKPGWYWLKCYHKPEVVQVVSMNGDMAIVGEGWDMRVRNVDRPCLWSGPLVPPEEKAPD